MSLIENVVTCTNSTTEGHQYDEDPWKNANDQGSQKQQCKGYYWT